MKTILKFRPRGQTYFLSIVLLIFLSGVAQADLFDFNTLENNDSSDVISAYMSGLYGSTVTVTDARARIKESPLPDAWTGNFSTYIWSANGGTADDFEILFESTPINALLGLGGTGSTRGFVFEETGEWSFQIFAYDSTYTEAGGTVENPYGGALVDAWSIVVGDGTQISIPDLIFSRSVSLLVISNDGVHDIAIDDLQVTPVPVPAAVLLGVLGFGVAGMKLRKFA